MDTDQVNQVERSGDMCDLVCFFVADCVVRDTRPLDLVPLCRVSSMVWSGIFCVDVMTTSNRLFHLRFSCVVWSYLSVLLSPAQTTKPSQEQSPKRWSGAAGRPWRHDGVHYNREEKCGAHPPTLIVQEKRHPRKAIVIDSFPI